MRARIRVAAADRRASEGHAFRALVRACHRADPQTIEKALIAWLDRIGPGMTAERLASHTHSGAFADAVRPLERVLYSREAGGVLTLAERKTLRSALRHVRRETRARKSLETSHGILPPLNPTQGRSDHPTI